jgi:tRNA(fMet)-specific endonuclease VapC
VELILDTTILIDIERDHRGLHDLIDDADSVAIAAITYAELLHGVEMADPANRSRRQRFVEAIAERVPILSYDRRVTANHAVLLAAVQREGQPRGAHDLIIAATAATFDMLVVTTNPRHFHNLPGVSVREVNKGPGEQT